MIELQSLVDGRFHRQTWMIFLKYLLDGKTLLLQNVVW